MLSIAAGIPYTRNTCFGMSAKLTCLYRYKCENYISVKMYPYIHFTFLSYIIFQSRKPQ